MDYFLGDILTNRPLLDWLCAEQGFLELSYLALQVFDCRLKGLGIAQVEVITEPCCQLLITEGFTFEIEGLSKLSEKGIV